MSAEAPFGLGVAAKSKLLEKVKRRAQVSAADAPAPQSLYAEFTRIDRLQAYYQIQVHKAAAQKMGLKNPYEHNVDGLAGATLMVDGRETINFASYNYLGINGDPRLSEALTEAAMTWGTSTGASRVVSGERPIHCRLEQALAANYDAEDALTFVSGHATNVSTVSCLLGPSDLIIHDSLVHNSVLEGARLSPAARRSFAHNDMEDLKRLLATQRSGYQRVLIVVEGLYSMDGDLAALDRLVELKHQYGCLLMVDEAHSLGVIGATGRGVFEHFGINPSEIDIWMGTLSKTLAGCGGYIAGSAALIELLRYRSPGFVYSVGMPPPMAAVSLAALGIMQSEPDRVRRLASRRAYFFARAEAEGIDLSPDAVGAVIPYVIGSSLISVRLSEAMLARGINVAPIIYPAVEEGAARLRFFLSADHSDEQIATTLRILAEESRRLCEQEGTSATAGLG